MTIECGKCKAQFSVGRESMGTRKEGKLEVTFITCPQCGAEYVTTVTDAQLRKDIKRFRKMNEIIQERKESGTRIPESFEQKRNNLLKSNLERSRVLKEAYRNQEERVQGQSS